MAPQLAVSVLDYLSPAAKAASLPLLFPLLLILLLLPYLASASRSSSKKLPPSPPGALPLIGHAHLVAALPHSSFRRLATQHPGCGDFMTIRLGAVPTMVASSSRAAQALLRTHELAFSSRVHTACVDVLTYGPADVAFEPYGERWRQSRKLVATHLLSATKVRAYRAARLEEVELVVGQVRSAAAAGVGVDVSELTRKFTNDMVCQAVAGRAIRVEGRDRVFRDLINQTLAILSGFNLENFYPGIARVAGSVLMWPLRRKTLRLRDRWDDFLDRFIDLRMSEVGNNGVVASADQDQDQDDRDLLHVLLSVQQEYGLTRDRIKGLMANMVAAATDSTFGVLEMAMAELMLHPDVMAKLQAEVRKSVPHGQNFVTEDDLVGMPYLKAVVKETLRIHPPTPLLPRVSHEDCVVDGYTIPAGMPVIVNAWALGRDPTLWDAAEEFIPERFIDTGDTTCPDFRGMNFQYLPFGSGRRMCPGIGFATAHIEIMLANLMFHFDWELPSSVDTIDMTEVFKLTVSLKEKLILNPKLRGDIIA
ncbi:unnamed protein product [Urochloa decumbens]|uniref:Uncharacterized protein n=1 Tax=Urochloa decumbens TaxID=240449 RepID=A0ABC9D766_9POAL